MQKKHCIIILLSMIFISCGHRYTQNETILCAEKIMNSNPDSAYQLLSNIPHPDKLPKADYAAWCLHYTHARVKLHKEIKSDSLIKIPVNYYKNSQLPKYSGIAYYLSGRVARLNNRNKVALNNFKLAEDILSKTNEESYKGLVKFYLGYLCMEDELYNHSLNYFRRSLVHFQLSKDKKYQAYSYREISDMYNELDYPLDSVLHYSDMALKKSIESGDSVNYYSILLRQGGLLYKKNYKKSNQFILKGYKHSQSLHSYYAAILSLNYSELKQPDSASYYLKLSFADTINTHSNPVKYVAAAYVAKNERNYKEAFENIEKGYLIRDSMYQQKIRSQLYRIDKQYDLSKKERENAQLKIENQKNTIWIGLLVIFSLLVSITLLLVNHSHKKKQAAHKLEKQRMEFEVKKKELENEQKRKLLLSKLQSKIENTLRFNRLKMGLKQQEKFDAFMTEITKQSIVSEEDWHYYVDEANHIFENKITKLSTTYSNLTFADLKVIVLICLGMDISDSASLLETNKNTLYHRRKIIKERIGIETEIELDGWIRQNVISVTFETQMD
jgi:hypothetical protein